MTTVVGFDLSLSRPAAFAFAWEDQLTVVEREERILGEMEQTEHAKIARIVTIANWAVHFASRVRCRAAYVENYAFSKNTSSVTRLAELGGAVRMDMMRSLQLTMTPVGASEARKIFLGYVPPKNAKEYTRRRVLEACPELVGENASDDVCDAFVIANFGRYANGLPCFCLEEKPPPRVKGKTCKS